MTTDPVFDDAVDRVHAARRLLAAGLAAESVETYLRSRNRNLGGQSPLWMLLAGGVAAEQAMEEIRRLEQ